MKRDSLLSLLCILGLSFTIACSNEPAEEKPVEEKAKPQLVEDTPADEEGFDFFLPSAIQINHILKKSGVLYQEGLTNDPEKYSQYETRAKRLLNLGVYTGDLAYCVLNGQTEKGMKYVASLKNLANELDLAEVYHSSEALDQMEASMNNQDSLLTFIITTQERLNEYAHTNHQLSLLLETFTGAWVETMYLGANAENKHPEFINKRLSEQLGILENLIQGLEMSESNNQDLLKVIADLKDFKESMPVYDIDNNEALTPEQFETLRQKITDIRNSITNS